MNQHPALDVPPSPGTVTRILTRQNPATDAELAEAITVVYDDLHRIARRLMINERPSPTFDAESLLHDAYVRLARHNRTQWRNRGHLFAVAARLMRRVLVDRSRHRRAAKRGGPDLRLTTLDGKELANSHRGLDVLVLDSALADLARHDARLSQLVELRFFGGLSNPEIAAIQGVTTMTVVRRWRLGRAWLHRHLTKIDAAP